MLVENAIKILNTGKLLSSVLSRNISAAELAKEPRNAANDPEDYYHYIMFAWGNCQAGDRESIMTDQGFHTAIIGSGESIKINTCVKQALALRAGFALSRGLQ